MAMAFPQRRPTASFSDRLMEGWRLVRSGRIRCAASELANASRRDLTAAERIEHASLLLTCRLATGDVAGASTMAAHLEPALSGAGSDAVIAHLAHGELAAANGDHERALGHFRRAGEPPTSDDPALTPWRSGASLAMVHLGQRADAAALARELLDVAERTADPWQLAVALRTVATVDAATDTLPALDRARRFARAAGDLRLTAQTGTDLAGLLLLVGSNGPAQALALLRSAEEYAAQEAIWPLHARIGRLLERAGERPRPLRGEATDLLTDGEQRVARLAARGLTNRQIAEQLTVTIKGVEWHLSRIYRKLGIASRQDLLPLLDVPVQESATA
jgi:ATP/maltotriose-dependent transcriptional regulator MalT